MLKFNNLIWTIVHDANTTVVSIGDVLSDSVYYYDRKKDQILVKA